MVDQKVIKGKNIAMNELKLYCDQLKSFGR